MNGGGGAIGQWRCERQRCMWTAEVLVFVMGTVRQIGLKVTIGSCVRLGLIFEFTMDWSVGVLNNQL